MSKLASRPYALVLSYVVVHLEKKGLVSIEHLLDELISCAEKSGLQNKDKEILREICECLRFGFEQVKQAKAGNLAFLSTKKP